MKSAWRMKGLRFYILAGFAGTLVTLVVAKHTSASIFHDMIAIVLGFVFGFVNGVLAVTGWWIGALLEHGPDGDERRASLKKALNDYDVEHGKAPPGAQE